MLVSSVVVNAHCKAKLSDPTMAKRKRIKRHSIGNETLHSIINSQLKQGENSGAPEGLAVSVEILVKHLSQNKTGSVFCYNV